MRRTQISLGEEERQTLDRLSAETGRSMSALIREAVQLAYGPFRSVETDLAAMRRGAGAWKREALDGASYVDTLRSGRRLSSER